MKVNWPKPSDKKSFASDNNSGIHPKILAGLSSANTGQYVSYGDDPYTSEAIKVFKLLLGKKTDPYIVYNGTGANVTGLGCLLHSFESIIACDSSHINCDECGSPEHILRSKIQTIPNTNGKLTVNQIKPFLEIIGDEHHTQPKVISITQATELGTVYTTKEIKAICKLAHSNNMYVHMDGARIANACIALDKTCKELTFDCGIDVLSFGGTKNGMAYGEAVIFSNSNISEYARFYRKQNTQLASKMRYISAQFLAYFENDLWLSNALNANETAKYLEEKIKDSFPQFKLTQNVETNAIFIQIPKDIALKMQDLAFFYPWSIEDNEYRWMTSFETTKKDVDDFIAKMQKTC
ncbi:MAG: threonine aldolase [Caldisericia bacterium]|nr:threonine aldolase [Caldisericia bacterium]